MTPTTLQAVRDAQMELADAWFLGPREATRALANFESAVRADEAAGLVDILARLVEGMSVNSKHSIRCFGCGGRGEWYEDSPYPIQYAASWYVAHTPDCPWVEGMNAVALANEVSQGPKGAERRGHA